MGTVILPDLSVIFESENDLAGRVSSVVGLKGGGGEKRVKSSSTGSEDGQVF